MSDWDFVKVKQKIAQEITDKIELSEEAVVMIKPDLTSEAFVSELIDNELFTDAVLFLSNALAKREATWWACLCARGGLKDKASQIDMKAIELAEAWVFKPTAESCAATAKVAEETKFETAAGWAAMAAFWSGDNISTVGGITLAPEDDMTGKAVNAAELLAATCNEAEKVNEYHRLFLQQGINIACGGNGQLS